MRFFGLLGGSQRDVVLTKIANQLARDSRQEVFNQVALRCGSMSKAEARGYVRAIAAVCLRRKSAARLQREPADLAAHHDELSAMATEIVVQLVLGEIMRMRLRARDARKVA